jgi:predicted RecB family nuclease
VYLIGLWNASSKTYTALWDVAGHGTIWDGLNDYFQSLHQPYTVWYWYAEKNKCVSLNAAVDMTCWNDMCDVAKYMGMKGVFDFSLKSFVRVMYAHDRLPFSYDDMECSDGGASIDLARRYFENGDDQIRDTLEKYNRCDCEAMWYVHQEITQNIVP